MGIWHMFFSMVNMEKNKSDIVRNTPAEKGRDNDPNLRDRSGIQPGVSTISNSNSDELNEEISKTASDNFNEDDFGKDADTAFDEIGKGE